MSAVHWLINIDLILLSIVSLKSWWPGSHEKSGVSVVRLMIPMLAALIMIGGSILVNVGYAYHKYTQKTRPSKINALCQVS